MSTSPHLSGKLREALGNEAGDELIGIVDKAAGDISDLRGDVAELRHEMRVGFADLKADLAGRIANVKGDLMRWSFVFWVGAVAAIALLAGVLRT